MFREGKSFIEVSAYMKEAARHAVQNLKDTDLEIADIPGFDGMVLVDKSGRKDVIYLDHFDHLGVEYYICQKK